jgi:signal transduction histidine kinase
VRTVGVRDSRDTAVSFRDVTSERQTSERRLDLYSIIAHDLRSPLATMMLRIDVMTNVRRAPMDPSVADGLGKMKRRMADLVSMVDDFLDLARLENAEMRIVPTALDLRELATHMVDDFAPLAEKTRIVMTLHAGEEPISVEGDRQRLAQVFSNLLSNALKFTPEGGTVVVTLVADAERVDVTVSDSGLGIAEATLPTLFQRYVRSIDVHHTVAGTGLGLMIVRQIVEAHGGEVRVTSQHGKGSTFGFTLPRALAPSRTWSSRPLSSP